jgi:hypothetical protein
MQRTMRKTTYICLAATGVCCLLVMQWRPDSHLLMAADKENLTVPLAGLNPAQKKLFDDGLKEFMRDYQDLWRRPAHPVLS